MLQVAVGCRHITWDGAWQPPCSSVLRAAWSGHHVGEMIAENFVFSPQIGGDGEEGGGTWCGRLRQRLGRPEKQEQAEDKDTADFLPIKNCYFGTISPRWGGLAEMCKSSQKHLEWPSSGGWRQTATAQPLGTTGAGEPGGKDTHCACVRGTASMGRVLRGGGRSGTRSQCLAQSQQVAGSDLAPRPSHFGCWATQKLCKQE